jgi:hypothetical protein
MWAHKVPSDNWVSVPGWDARRSEETCRVPREAFILRSIRCEGVVGFVDLFSDDNFVYLVRVPYHMQMTWSLMFSSRR